jgi:hypothetical protein
MEQPTLPSRLKTLLMWKALWWFRQAFSQPIRGICKTLSETIDQRLGNLQSIDSDEAIVHLVTDKGYHKASLIQGLYWEQGITTCIPERETSQRRRWNGNDKRCRAFHGNRRRCKSEYEKWLKMQRSAIVERVFAHLMVTGGLRIHLYGKETEPPLIKI